MSKITDKIDFAKELIGKRDFENALMVFDEVAQAKLNKHEKFDITLHRGIIKMNIGLYEESQEELQKALEISEKNEDRFEQTRALHQLGIISKLLGDYPRATELLREELRRCSSLIPTYYSDLSYNFFEQGDVKMLSGEYEDAEMYFRHAYTFAGTEENYHGVGLALQALAHLKLHLGDKKKAHDYLQESYQYFKKANSEKELGIVENELTALN